MGADLRREAPVAPRHLVTTLSSLRIFVGLSVGPLSETKIEMTQSLPTRNSVVIGETATEKGT